MLRHLANWHEEKLVFGFSNPLLLTRMCCIQAVHVVQAPDRPSHTGRDNLNGFESSTSKIYDSEFDFIKSGPIIVVRSK